MQKQATCVNCRIPVQAVLHRQINSNGAECFCWVCPKCNRHNPSGGKEVWIPKEKVYRHLTQEQIESLPLLMPKAYNRCVKCGKRECELHHWAPRAIFGNAECEQWPQDYLCDECHKKWHKLVTPQLVRD